MRNGKVSGQQRGWYGAFDDGRDSARRKGVFGRRLSPFKAKGDRGWSAFEQIEKLFVGEPRLADDAPDDVLRQIRPRVIGDGDPSRLLGVLELDVGAGSSSARSNMTQPVRPDRQDCLFQRLVDRLLGRSTRMPAIREPTGSRHGFPAAPFADFLAGT